MSAKMKLSVFCQKGWMEMKTIGIIGGLGPMATVYYLELLTRMTDAVKDQEHPRIFLESLPDIPDRTAYVLDRTAEDPIPVMIDAAKTLQNIGAELLTIPCITAHCFYDQVVEHIDIPVLHLPRYIAQDVAEKGIHTVGILATTGTIQSGILKAEFAAVGVETIILDAERQNLLMQIIYEQMKKGTAVNWQMFLEIAESLLHRGAEKLVLGCTELPLLKKDIRQIGNSTLERLLTEDSIDVLEVLAQHALLMADVSLKEEYQDVIS